MSEETKQEDNEEAKTGVVKTATEPDGKIEGKSKTVDLDSEEHRELEAQTNKANPVGDESAEPESVPSKPEIAKESKTEAGEEIDGKSETTVVLDAEEYRKMKEQADKAKEHWDQWLRCLADFDNFKKGAARERSEAVEKAKVELLKSLIPALDNFDMAMAYIENAGQGSVDSLKQGVNMVFKQLKSAIRELGMEEIHAVGQMFNHDWHEAVEQRESNEVPEGHVIEQTRKGYKLKDRLIRAANVVVAKPKVVDSADSVANKTSAEVSAKD